MSSTERRVIPPLVMDAAKGITRNILSVDARRQDLLDQIEKLQREIDGLPAARDSLMDGLRAMIGDEEAEALVSVFTGEIPDFVKFEGIPEDEVIDVTEPRVVDTRESEVEELAKEEPPEPETKPEPEKTKPIQARTSPPTESYDQVMAKAKELGIFTVRRLSESLDAVKKSRVQDAIKQAHSEGSLNRHGGQRGPGVFYSHPDYQGELTFTLARGGVSYGEEHQLNVLLRPDQLLAWIEDNAADRAFQAQEAQEALSVGRSVFERCINILMDEGKVKRVKLGSYALSSIKGEWTLDTERLLKWWRHAYPEGFVQLKDVIKAFPEVHESTVGDTLREAVNSGELVRPKLGWYHLASWRTTASPPKKEPRGRARELQQKKSGKVTDEQFRDWIIRKHAGDRFTIRDMVDDLGADINHARSLATNFVNRNIIREKKGGEFEYVPPPVGPKERPKRPSPEGQLAGIGVRGRGTEVPYSGRTMGRSGKPSLDKKRAATGRRVASKKGGRK